VDAGVGLMLHTWFAQPLVADNTVSGVIVENKSGRLALRAKVVIDASGDGDVAARAGAEYWQTRKSEAPRLGDGLMYRLEFGAKRPEGVFACDFGGNAVMWGPASEPIDATDADQLSQAEVAARLKVYQHLAGERKAHPELADARIIETPPLLGIRQTRFIEGQYKLTADDAIEGRRFDDVIAISSCAIINYYGFRRYLKHEGYDIPYRCLVPKSLEGLLIAGRCISSEQQPYESHRAMIPMIAIGQAAGTAAALCSRTGLAPRKIDVAMLQDALIQQGAQLRRERSRA
jgi:hypothetical protein